MAVAEEVTVFADTNLGTRIVMNVPLDIRAGDFKRILENTHANCLPSLGEIHVHGLMVQRKSHFYHIAEPVPIKYIFKNNQTPWFICAKARLVNRSQHPSIPNIIGLSHVENRKMKKSFPEQVLKPDTRILQKREFLGSSTTNPKTIRSSLSRGEAAEMKNSNISVRNSLGQSFTNFIPKTQEKKARESLNSQTLSKKLLMAANNIRMQGKSRYSSSLSSIFRFKSCRKRSLDGKKVSSLAKFQVFQISDDED